MIEVKKLLLCAGILLLGMQAGFAQAGKDTTRGDKQRKVETLKIAYLSQQLDLSPAEAQQFWPVYNRYQEEARQLIADKRRHQLSRTQLQQASNEQAASALNNEFDFQQKALQLRTKYKQEFLKVLPPKKVMLLYKSEHDFNSRLIRELRNRRNP